jgi:hypothetical protein
MINVMLDQVSDLFPANQGNHLSQGHNSADPLIPFLFTMQICELLFEYANRGGGYEFTRPRDSECW